MRVSSFEVLTSVLPEELRVYQEPPGSRLGLSRLVEHGHQSLAKRRIGIAPSDTPASSVIATDESTRASSSSARHSAK